MTIDDICSAKSCEIKHGRTGAACALAVALLALYPSAASGQSGLASSPASPSSARAPVSDSEPKAVATAPASTPSTCDTYLPAGFMVPQTARTTLLAYRVDETGSRGDVSLYRSSGNSDLDKAALACVSAIKITPSPDSSMLVDGKPAEVTLIGGVFWGERFHSFGEPTPAGEPNRCYNKYPPIAIRLDQEGTVVVDTHIAADGTVENAIVAQSSNYPALDQASLDCVKSHRYFPAIQNGQPVEIERKERVNWRLRRQPLPGPVVNLTVGKDGSVGLEGQRYFDVDALRAKLAEIASRNPRPELCQLPMRGASNWRDLAAMSRVVHLLAAAGIPSVRFCTAPFAE